MVISRGLGRPIRPFADKGEQPGERRVRVGWVPAQAIFEARRPMQVVERHPSKGWRHRRHQALVDDGNAVSADHTEECFSPERTGNDANLASAQRKSAADHILQGSTERQQDGHLFQVRPVEVIALRQDVRGIDYGHHAITTQGRKHQTGGSDQVGAKGRVHATAN